MDRALLPNDKIARINNFSQNLTSKKYFSQMHTPRRDRNLESLKHTKLAFVGFENAYFIIEYEI